MTQYADFKIDALYLNVSMAWISESIRWQKFNRGLRHSMNALIRQRNAIAHGDRPRPAIRLRQLRACVEWSTTSLSGWSKGSPTISPGPLEPDLRGSEVAGVSRPHVVSTLSHTGSMERSQAAASRPFNDFSHLSAGADFLRADLHIHSYGVSRDVGDQQMTVDGIIETAQQRSLDVVAVADHNAIDSVPVLLDAAPKAGLVAFAGVEITTGEGHVLVYFAPDRYDAFKAWFGRLTFNEDKSGDRHVLVPIHELLESVDKAGGIAIPAHIGRDKTGFLARVSPQIEDAIIASPFLRAVEIDTPAESAWYSPSDSGDGSARRIEVLKRREDALGPVAGRRLAKVFFSDAHSLAAIGRDRDGKDRVIRIKMGEPSFDAFRTALADPDARIKLEADLPNDYPRIVGVRLLGGFLDGQEIAFSANLTCLIGGRGTGKSTAIESVRCTCLGQPSEMDGEPNCPATVQLIYRDEFEHDHYMKRDADRTTYELTDDGAVEMHVAIEGYDQDRIAAIIRGYRDEPRQLLDFLDRFAELGEINVEMQSLRNRLATNGDELLPLSGAVKKLETEMKSLEETRVKLKAIQGSNLKEALQWRRLLQRERQVREELESRLATLEGDVDSLDVSVNLRGLIASAEIEDVSKTPSAEILLGKDGSPGLLNVVENLDSQLSRWKKDGTGHVAGAKRTIGDAVAKWKEREHAIEARVQAVFEELRQKNINPNVAEFNRLTAAEATAVRAVREHEAAEKRQADLFKLRRQLLKDYREAQTKRFQLRSHAMRKLTDQLNDAFDEFKVKLGFREATVVDEYATWVREAIGGRFLIGRRVENLCRSTHPVELADLARRRDVVKLRALADDAGTFYFADDDEAAGFASALRGRDVAKLELIAPDDRPEISLTTEVKSKPRKVDFENLSFGQKASILLGALLFSSEQSPLIIDQPEDHLDSQFIARTVVSVLRRVKESRQVIIATHNANITVLGDAEQIVPLQGYEGRGLTRDVGSVDAPKTRERACEILEGGEAAYRRRGEMYGFDIKAR